MTGRIAAITGGTSGIGLDIARTFVAHGAEVVLIGRREDALGAALDELGEAACGLVGDVTVMADLDRMAALARDRHGRVDIVVTSAGIAGGGPLDTCPEDEFDRVFDLNVKATFFTCQKMLPMMGAGGSIILVSSVSARITLPNSSVYAGSKAALLGFARNWAFDLGPRGIRVNMLGPGITQTPLLDRLQSTPESMARFEEIVGGRIMLGRRGRSEEIAKAALFLASDEASYVTGGALYADGGLAEM